MPTQDIEYERPLPVSADAERSVLGAILMDNELFFDDIADLKVEDFALDSHRIIFACMNEILFGLVDGIVQVDTTTLGELLHKKKKISVIGGMAYVFSLTEGLPRRVNVEGYVTIIKEKAKARRLIGICSKTITKLADQSEDAKQIETELQNELVDESADGQSRVVKIGDVTPVVESRIHKKRKSSEERTAVELTWGVPKMDDWTKGLFGGELTVLGGDSGGGKTQLAVQITLANAREGKPCAWISLEMPKENVVTRYYPIMGDIITADHMRDPRLMNLHTHIPEMQRLSGEMESFQSGLTTTTTIH